MHLPVDWQPSRQTGDIAEQMFVLHGPSGPVPGVLWMPRGTADRPPLVLVGHGGSSHKRGDRVLSLARWFAQHAGIASLAIDGPYHGARAPRHPHGENYQTRIATEGASRVLDRMVTDWLAALDVVSAHQAVDADNVGYLGLSMGTRYGLPTAAALAGRLRCAVFGKFGLEQTSELHPAMDTTPRITADAPKILAPTLFHMQWNDDRFTRAGQLALFDLLGSPDKQLLAFTGPHNQTHPHAIRAWQTFTAEHLTGRESDSPRHDGVNFRRRQSATPGRVHG
jgi:dienelactone hydrolase